MIIHRKSTFNATLPSGMMITTKENKRLVQMPIDVLFERRKTMLTFIFVMCMLGVFGKLIGVAIDMAWGITKVLFTLVFLPLIIIGFVIGGLMKLAIPILVIVGLYTLITSMAREV